jgi:hypothetical protein
MQFSLHRRTLKPSLLLGVLLAATQIAAAQAVVSAERGAELAPFVQTTLLSPDWGPTRNFGYTVGVDYTRFIHSHSIVQPSVEFRFTSANGHTVNEHSYAGGLKLQTTIRRIHPYATLLVGKGTITFNYDNGNYYGDSSFIYSIGGGADFNVAPQWKVRLDYTHQHWNLDPNTLTPTTLGVGIAYTLPFRTRQVN